MFSRTDANQEFIALQSAIVYNIYCQYDNVEFERGLMLKTLSALIDIERLPHNQQTFMEVAKQ